MEDTEQEHDGIGQRNPFFFPQNNTLNDRVVLPIRKETLNPNRESTLNTIVKERDINSQ